MKIGEKSYVSLLARIISVQAWMNEEEGKKSGGSTTESTPGTWTYLPKGDPWGGVKPSEARPDWLINL